MRSTHEKRYVWNKPELLVVDDAENMPSIMSKLGLIIVWKFKARPSPRKTIKHNFIQYMEKNGCFCKAILLADFIRPNFEVHFYIKIFTGINFDFLHGIKVLCLMRMLCDFLAIWYSNARVVQKMPVP
jgi:hypothetical protein